MSRDVIQIDGSQGEGGGQILRTALGLSALTGKPFRIANIRANRPKPGLLRQHLTAVNAAVAICEAQVDGDAIGSRELAFRPGKVKPGHYTFAVGSAGSTTLVFQTVLPALLMAGEPSNLVLEGGTHNPFAPPLDFLEQAFLPIIHRLGSQVNAAIERYGFYPAGGGRWFATITPGSLKPITLDERGDLVRREARALVAGLAGEIGLRELERVGERLHWSGDELRLRQVPRDQGPGNAVMLMIHSRHVTEVFTGFGQRGVGAEAVADAAIDEAKAYLDSGAAVGEHLADQLLIPFALAGGGSFVTSHVSGHTQTNIEIIRRFLDVSITPTPATGGGVRITVERR